MYKLLIFTFVLFTTIPSMATHSNGTDKDRTAIIAQAKAFSKAFVDRNVDGIMAIYSPGARIVNGNKEIEKDLAAIRKLWTPDFTNKWRLQWHKTETEELIIDGNLASDIGYYSGLTKHEDGRDSKFRGAYVIVWKKIDGIWRMNIDMWNSIKDKSK